jgi:hypothetical protein
MTDELDVTASAEPISATETPAIEGDGAPTPPDPTGNEPSEPRSRLESIEKAFADIDEPDAGEPAKKAEPKVDESGRLRGPDGKFAAKDATEPEAEPAKAPEGTDRGTISEPPSRFSPDAKEAWKDAPDSVKGEIKRAITELESGLAQKDAQLEPLKPFFDMAQQHGVTVDGALGNYVRMEQLLAKDMRAGLDAIAQNFGISFDQMIAQATGQAQSGQPDPRDQKIAQLTSQIHDLTNQINGVSTTVNRSQEQAIMAEVESFASDKPAFDYLQDDIAARLSANSGMTLDQAYNAALENAQRVSAVLNPPSQPDNPASPAAPTQPREQRSVTGAPNAGSDPGTRKPSRNRSEALQRAFSATGLT